MVWLQIMFPVVIAFKDSILTSEHQHSSSFDNEVSSLAKPFIVCKELPLIIILGLIQLYVLVWSFLII
jgi:hypothetical protein